MEKSKFELAYSPELSEVLLRDGSMIWVVSDGWTVDHSGTVRCELWCCGEGGRPDPVIETLLFPRRLAYLSGYDDDAPAVSIDDFVEFPPHPQDSLEDVGLVGGFEFWTLPLSSGGVMRVTAQGCRRVGDDVQFTVSCVGDPGFDIVMVQVPLGVVEAGVARVLVAEGRPPVQCVSEWAPLVRVRPQDGLASSDDAGSVD